jgi:predicted esterase
MPSTVSDFRHRFIPAEQPGAPTLLTLHGTGGDENDLLPLARIIDPHAAVLSPRGRVLENGMPRFFRRIREGVFDQEDLARRTIELADFLSAAAAEYHFDAGRVIAVGYSNGANIAASLLLSRPGVLAAAVLLRPMVPFEPAPTLDLRRRPILVSAGRRDQIIPPPLTERLVEILTRAGAEVTSKWYDAGHELSQSEVKDAAGWYAANVRLP